MGAVAFLEAMCLLVLVVALGTAAAEDLRRRVVPNACVLAVWASGLVAATAAGPLPAAVLRALAGTLVVLAVMLLARWLSARGGGRGGVGGGDVKLLAAVAAWTGPVGGLVVVGLSCAIGLMGWGAAALLALLRHRGIARAMPLAPSILLATAAVLVVRYVWLA